MSKVDNMGDVNGVIRDAVAETNELIERIADDAQGDYAGMGEKLAARYRQVMDDAETMITYEYRQEGTLNSALICELNKNMDEYTLSMQTLLEKLRQFDETEQE